MTLAADLDLPRAALSAPARPAHGASKHSETDAAAETVLWAVPIVLLALVLAVQTWGLVALTLTAVTLVPVIFVLLIWITLP
ncbi:hypothetical protein [Pseudogemmobacter blasticus]|uniref:Uncharacterized protein n=1 Tax=Fuscovulum blasticum DSM 2131 TaxID=1188250 RepID=A0A2T4JDM3_FUSBL|nr:hypothetical protein [Fuscovulum blasticum]PTE16014.1 hypothetical protein C5F44_02985 [Fuscovulum blasticum DSM 2131]